MKINVNMTFDFVCPWCYIGETRLLKAIQSLPNLAVDVHWKPFEFNPNMPAEGVDLKEYMDNKYGPGHFEAMVTRVTAIGHADGIALDYDKATRLPNTNLAHQLVIFARRHQREHALITRIFIAYFGLGLDIANPQILANLAEETGLNKEAALQFLAENAGQDEVKSLEREGRMKHINGVPLFEIEDITLSGAQPLTVFRDSLLKAAAEK